MSSAVRDDLTTARYFGLYPALVIDVVDPTSLGRVKISFPWLGAGATDVFAWATLLSPYAEDDAGFLALPSVGSQVVVAFEGGELRRPYVVGAAWNGREALPHQPDAANNLRTLKTRSGTVLEFDDTDGATKVTLRTPSGHMLVLDDGSTEVALTHSAGHTVTLTPSGTVEIHGNASVDITAPTLNVHSGVANFDGLINCTTVICSAGVVSPSYTPGAGNIW